MRTTLIFSLVFQLSVLPVNAGQKKSKVTLNSARIEDYFINPQKDFSWMSDSEKAAYISFLYNLNLIVDTELNKNSLLVVANEKTTTSHIDIQKEILKRIFTFNEAHAVLPLVPVTAALVAAGVRAVAPQVIKNMGRRRVIDMGMVVDVTPKAEVVKTTVSWWSRLVSAKGVAAVSTAASVPLVASTFLDGDKNSVKSKTQPIQPATAQARSSELNAKAAKINATNTTPVAVTDARVDGSFCIFGGYASKYKNIEGRSFCPAPAEMVNSPICSDKKLSPSFLCQSFGLSTSPHVSTITDSLCIPLRSENGLKDLTVRCVKAFANFTETAKSFDPQKIDEIQKQIMEGVRALENERGVSDVGILAYCADQNIMNRGNQKNECSALTTMMQDFKKSLPTIASAAQNKAKPGSDLEQDSKKIKTSQ